MSEAALRTEDPPIDRNARLPWFVLVAGWTMALSGAGATILALPTTLEFPVRTLLAVSVCASGIGILYRRSWAIRPVFVVAVLLVGTGVAYLALGGTSSVVLAGWCVPGVFLGWVAVRLHMGARTSRYAPG
jgi:hypothetical protein